MAWVCSQPPTHYLHTGPLEEPADSTPGGKLFPSLSVEPRGVEGQG